MNNNSITQLISAREIRERVVELAAQIDKDYGDSSPILIGVLNGSFIFLSDLVRNLKAKCVIDFVGVASYGKGTKAGQLKLLRRPQVPVKGKRVLIVDDILDKGNTLHLIRNLLFQKKPLDVRTCILLSKQCRREVEVETDYIGFEVPDRFVVGYGLDYAGNYRQLAYIGMLDEGAG